MTSKKKPAPKTHPHPLKPQPPPKAATAIAQTPPPTRAEAKRIIEQLHETVASRDSLGQRVIDHMAKHGVAEPWSAMNAGGVCGICKERV